MNREILFRGKRMYGGVWLYGSLRQYKDGTSGICDRELEHTYRVDPSTVGQFTGLTDKNGKKMFEGDIIRFDGEEFVVFWNGEAFQWQAKSTHARENVIIYDTGNPFSQLNELANAFDFGWIAAEPILGWEMTTEVIGNVHDNPELMEGE